MVSTKHNATFLSTLLGYWSEVCNSPSLMLLWPSTPFDHDILLKCLERSVSIMVAVCVDCIISLSMHSLRIGSTWSDWSIVTPSFLTSRTMLFKFSPFFFSGFNSSLCWWRSGKCFRHQRCLAPRWKLSPSGWNPWANFKNQLALLAALLPWCFFLY